MKKPPPKDGKMIEIRWHGRGGQGSFTAAKLLGISASLYEDKHALAFPAFGPERRGAPVLAFTKIDNTKIKDRSEVKKCDYIVILDETLFNPTFFDDLKPHGKIILNASNHDKYATYDVAKLHLTNASKTASEILGKPITNTAMLGALVGVSEIVQLQSVINGMSNFLKGKVLGQNIEVVKNTYEQNKTK